MSRCRNFLKDKWMYIAAILIPWCIALIHSAIADTWVTGHGNIATGDLQAQLIPIAYELWDRIHSGDGFSGFTWHLLDGMDVGTVTGFFHSPFTLVMLLFPRASIPDFIQLLMLTKWSLCSFSMCFFFYHTSFNTLTVHKRSVSLFLSLAFALGNGIMSFMLYIQFMDVIICFPFLLLLLENMVRNKSWKLYYLVLTFVIWANMYLAFQVCIFLVIWFGLNLLVVQAESLKKFIIFALSSLLSGMTWLLGAFGGISAANERYESTSVSRVNPYLEHMLVQPWTFIKQLFAFREIEAAASRDPNIYLSVTVLCFLFLFLFIKIDVKKKIYMIAVAVFFVISFFSGRVSLLWHVFNVPNGVYHRFMYLFVFWILLMYLQVLIHLEDIRLWQHIVSFVLLAGLYAYSLINIDVGDSMITYAVSALLILFLSLLLIFYMRKSIQYKNYLCIVVVCGVIELCANAGYTFSFYDEPLFYGKGSYTEQAVETLSQARLQEGERIVSQSPTPNIGMITGQGADCGFVSTPNSANKRLHEVLGMGSNSSVEYGARGGSPLINLIFNIRYGHGESRVLFSDCSMAVETPDLSLYRMERLAGLGYMVEEDITQWDAADKNCFQLQNDFVKLAVGGDDVFHPVKMDVTCKDFVGLTYERDPEFSEQGVYLYRHKGLFATDYDSLQMDIIMQEDTDLYMFYTGQPYCKIYIFIDGEELHRDVRRFAQSTYHIGQVKQGQRIAVCAVPNDNYEMGAEMQIACTFAGFDEEAYARAYDKLSRNVYQIDTFESDYIKGNIFAEKPGIMMTSVPTSGFQVYVDGKESRYTAIGGALIGIPLSEGEHMVEFRYKTSYKNQVIALVVFVVYLILCTLDQLYMKKRQALLQESV